MKHILLVLTLAVGFGVSRPEHVAELGRQVEAVVVGSAIVHLIERNLDNPSLEIQLESFALRWGAVGTGGIVTAFARALQTHTPQRIAAVREQLKLLSDYL